MAAEWIDTHVVVDDAVIARGNVLDIIDPVWWLASFYDDKATYERSLSRFSSPQRLVWAISWYQSEVFNGGHDQFFDNSTGMVWADALAGLKAIGAKPVESVLAEAVSRFGEPPSFETDERQGQLRSLYEAGGTLNDLDEIFFALPDRFDLEATVLAYIRANAAAFYFDGAVKRPPKIR
jgi:hypothetical protein